MNEHESEENEIIKSVRANGKKKLLLLSGFRLPLPIQNNKFIYKI